MSGVLTAEFAEFAEISGYSVGVDEGLEAVWNRGGEIRFHLVVDDTIELLRAERSSDPRSLLRTTDSGIVERYLTNAVGGDLRFDREFGRFLFLRAVGNLAPAEGKEVLKAPAGFFVRSSGENQPVVFADELDAVRYTFYADAPLDLMRESFLAPQGDPLFRDAWQRWQDRDLQT